MAGKVGFSLWKNGSRLVFRALVVLAVVLLLSGVGMVIWGCRMYYQYQQYLKALKYNFGDTAVITVISEDGSCELAPLNRYALYTFLSDSTGKRVEKSDDPLTGQTITFTGKSAVSSVSGSIDQTESGVRVTMASSTVSVQPFMVAPFCRGMASSSGITTSCPKMVFQPTEP